MKEETIYQIVRRISKETPFSYNDIYDVYLSNGNEELTRNILEISNLYNISPRLISRAVIEPVDLSCFIRDPLYKRIFNFIIGLFI